MLANERRYANLRIVGPDRGYLCEMLSILSGTAPALSEG